VFQVFHYVGKPSPIHSLDPRTKILCLFPILLLTVVSRDPIVLFLVFASVLVLFLPAKIEFHSIKVLLKFALIGGLLLVPLQTLFHYRFLLYGEPVLPYGFWIVTKETARSLPLLGQLILWATNGRGIIASLHGFLFVLMVTLRFVIMFFAGSFVVMTTKPKDIILTFNKLGVPFKITFTAMTGLRFLPIILEEWTLVMRAQSARGMRFRKLSIRNLMKVLSRSLSALIINSVRRARIIAFAMETRAFGLSKRRTTLTELQMDRTDKIVRIAICFVTASIVTLLILFPTFLGKPLLLRIAMV
jgi:energy-coupling factor transport system permease protein